MKVEFVKEIWEKMPNGKPIMVHVDGVALPGLYINTDAGILGVDVEPETEVGYTSANVFFIPKGADGDMCDLFSCRVKPNSKDLNLKIFADIFNEDPTEELIISRENIEEAFDIKED